MRYVGRLVGLSSIALFAWGCEMQPMCPEEGAGGSGDAGFAEGGCEPPPGGFGGGPGPDGQYRDEEGICRSDGDFLELGCAATFDLALAGPHPCGTAGICAGTCGEWLVVHHACTPSLGCTYDPLSRALVGVVRGDDVPASCGETSYTVTYGDGHHDCQFTDLIIDAGCWQR